MTSEITRSERRGIMLRWIGLAGIASIWIGRVIVAFSPQLYFDVDPLGNSDAIGAWGPAGSLWLDVLLLLSCAVAIVGHRLAGNAVNAFLYGLALLPAFVVLGHGINDAEDLWRGATWCAAMSAAVTVAHLSAGRRLRVIIIAVLLTTLMPILARGALQVTVEHGETLNAFEKVKDQIFASRGWTADSASAKIYERRLREPRPLGWFTTTNIFASVMVFGLIGWFGGAVAAHRSKSPSGWVGACGLMALLCVGGLAMAASKGAFAAVAIGFVLALAPLLNERIRSALIVHGRWLLPALVFAALGGIVVRGAVFDEGFLGDRSLLFRWHYLQGALRMAGDAFPFGVGPAGFQEHYVQVRPARSPEEVTSTHSMFVDWMVMLGIVGLAWVALVLRQLWSGAQDTVPAADDAPPVGAVATGFAAVAFAGGGVIGGVPQVPVLHALLLAMYALAMVVAVGMTGVVAAIGLRDARGVLGWSLLAGATALVIHGQIEMTFFQPGPVVWGACVLGVIAPIRSGCRFGPPVAVGGMVVAALVLVVVGAVPAVRQEAAVRDAVATLLDARGTLPERRMRCINALEVAYDRWPARVQPLISAVGQAGHGMSEGAGEPMLDRAIELMERGVAEHDVLRTRARRSALLELRAAHANSTEDLQRAIDDARFIAAMDQHATDSWKRLGRLLDSDGERKEATIAWRRALECDANFELDPLKQLSERERLTIERRAAEDLP